MVWYGVLFGVWVALAAVFVVANRFIAQKTGQACDYMHAVFAAGAMAIIASLYFIGAAFPFIVTALFALIACLYILPLVDSLMQAVRGKPVVFGVKRSLLHIVLAVLVGVGIFVLLSFSDPLAVQIRQVVEHANQNLPRKIGDNLEVQKVDYKDNTLMYKYKLLKTDVGLMPLVQSLSMAAGLKVTAIKEVCKDEDSVKLMSAGYTIAHLYYDRADTLITEVRITDKDCPE